MDSDFLRSVSGPIHMWKYIHLHLPCKRADRIFPCQCESYIIDTANIMFSCGLTKPVHLEFPRSPAHQSGVWELGKSLAIFVWVCIMLSINGLWWHFRITLKTVQLWLLFIRFKLSKFIKNFLHHLYIHDEPNLHNRWWKSTICFSCTKVVQLFSEFTPQTSLPISFNILILKVTKSRTVIMTQTLHPRSDRGALPASMPPLWGDVMLLGVEITPPNSACSALMRGWVPRLVPSTGGLRLGVKDDWLGLEWCPPVPSSRLRERWPSSLGLLLAPPMA